MATKKKPKVKATPKRVRDVSPERLRRFVELYMGEAAGVGAQAARLAGWKGTAKALSEQARRLLLRDDVKAMMTARVKEDPAVLSREDRQRFWSAVMRGDPIKVLVEGQEIEAAPPIAARLKASELLGKAQGDFVERHRHEHTGTVEHQVTVQVPPREALPEPEA
jgi:phage terminase small subunit